MWRNRRGRNRSESRSCRKREELQKKTSRRKLQRKVNKNEYTFTSYDGVHKAKMDAKRAVALFGEPQHRTEAACLECMSAFIPVLEEFEEEFEKLELVARDTKNLKEKIAKETLAGRRLLNFASELEFARSRLPK